MFSESLCLGLAEAPCPVVARDLSVTLAPSAPLWDTVGRVFLEPYFVCAHPSPQPRSHLWRSPSPTQQGLSSRHPLSSGALLCTIQPPQLPGILVSTSFSECSRSYGTPHACATAEGALGQKARGITGPPRVCLSQNYRPARCRSVSENSCLIYLSSFTAVFGRRASLISVVLSRLEAEVTLFLKKRCYLKYKCCWFLSILVL